MACRLRLMTPSARLRRPRVSNPKPSALHDLDRAVIVAVIVMMTVQAPLVNVVDVIPVQDPRMVLVLGGFPIVEITPVLGAPH
jgi:hypothetical protein